MLLRSTFEFRVIRVTDSGLSEGSWAVDFFVLPLVGTIRLYF